MLESTIPIVGGLALIIGSGLTIYVDRLERLRDKDTPRPVLYRFFSQAILAMHQWPHWIFVATCTIFGPCIFLTALWQATLLENECDAANKDQCQAVAQTMKIDGALTAIFVFLDAWIPLGRPIVTHISHTFVAIGFFVMGAHYVYNTMRMAQVLNDSEAVVTIRRSLLGIMMLAGIGIAATTSPAVKAHGRILDHQYRGTVESKMEQRDIVRSRRIEAAMSTLQMVLGIGLGLDMMTAVPDVEKLTEMNLEVPEVWWGSVMFETMLMMTFVQYLYRDEIFNWCQSMLLRFRTTKDNPKEN